MLGARALSLARGGPLHRVEVHSPNTSGGSTTITPQMADEAILAQLAILPAETLPLQQCVGQTLRQAVFAERENPPFDRVCMDGIAIASAAYERGLRRFRIESTQA